VSSFFRRLFLAATAATLLTAAGASAAAPEPVVEGNRIVDSLTSKKFVPHGVNFPGFEYACQRGFGDYGEDGTRPGEIGSTVAAMAAWKINTVRLPLNQDCWLGEDGMPAGGLTMSGYRQSVESFVEALNSVGIVAIVDLHWSGPDGVVADGLRPMPDDRSPTFWNSVANRFKDNPSIIFDLFNEPHSRWNPDDNKVFGLSWECWASGGCLAPSEADTAPQSGLAPRYQAAGMKNLTAVVRNTGATQPILLSGIDYANDLRGWLAYAPNDDQLIAGFHNYLVQRCRTVRCWDDEIAPLARQVPVLAAEFGQNDCGTPGHMNRFMDWADSQSIGYLAWAWWDLDDLGCSNFALVSDLDGTPLPPAGTALQSHLAGLPDELPDPPKLVSPGLAIKTAVFNGKNLRLEVVASPKATRAIKVSIRLIRNPRSNRPPRTRKRLIQRQLRLISGVAMLRTVIPAGLKPSLVTVSYPGDILLKPKTVNRKPSSVSRLTRYRSRG
jgi:hypothetical protein